MNGNIITVTQLNKYVHSIFDNDNILKNIIVGGEISNLKVNSFSGHIYLTLKDDKAAVKAVMFKSFAERLKFIPKEGMNVICRGQVTVYERDGAYQLYISDMQPDGAGSIAIAFEQLKTKLSAEGLFDTAHKKKLPQFPKKIAVITSETGAAVRDMISVIGRRWPVAGLVMCPVSVQGDSAPGQMIAVLEKVNRYTDCDVIIIGRGGGSTEDLWCFNDEQLARAIFDSEIPVISAVGHETDFTICDFVADLRAPTPSAAGEIAVPEISEIYSYFTSCDMRLENGISVKLNECSSKVESLCSRPVFTKRTGFIEPLEIRLDALLTKLVKSYESNVLKCGRRFEIALNSLISVNPTAVLLRGYSIAQKGGKTVKSVSSLRPGDNVNIVFSDGGADCTVNSVNFAKEKTNE